VSQPRPIVVILAGPNGAGKSTVAPALLQGALGVTEFVNADEIARGLSEFNPEGEAIAAGRVMLGRLRELSHQNVSFAFETTLASRSTALWLDELAASSYAAHLVFLWLPSADFALERVRDRVRSGGHDVPDEIVRRRYAKGIQNLFDLYQDRVETWRVYDASGVDQRMVAARLGNQEVKVYDESIWARIEPERADET
jgi:predicted ABC-type ATPase